MSSGHLKRLVAPRSWNIARKERTWTTKPMPGKHSLEGALPISTILRDYLKVCDNNREAKIILHNGEVLIDQRVVRKPKFPVGLMVQINLHDGTNILSKEEVKTGDVLQLNLPDLKIKKVLKFKKGAQTLIIGGSHVGSIATIKDEETTRSTKPNLVMYDGFQSIRPYSFVVGEKKAMVSLPEVKV